MKARAGVALKTDRPRVQKRLAEPASEENRSDMGRLLIGETKA
jgi:hypothetical protein